MADGSNGIRRGRKFDQVIEGARAVFMQDGFYGASVDDIARAAGVSKATLYSYFPDKSVLFMEVAKLECERQAAAADALIDIESGPRAVLEFASRRIIEWIFSDFGQRVFRICVAEADRFPALGAEFYESGPLRARQILVTYFRAAVARGELKIDDFELAADQFSELCKTDLFFKLVFGVISEPTSEQIDRVVVGAVDTFLARYGA